MNSYLDFTGLYPLSKTLRFELKPIGKTLENIEKKGIIASDIKRSEDYKLVKRMIDDYHKIFITESLSSQNFKEEDLVSFQEQINSYFELIQKNNKSEKEEEDLKKIVIDLRKIIVNQFNNRLKEIPLFKKELFTQILPNVYSDTKDKELIGKFAKFTTYFTGFHENRKNMYSDEEKSTSIAYRLVNENLPIFCANILSFKKLQVSEVSNNFSQIEQELNLDICSLNDIFSIKYYFRNLTQEQIDKYNEVLGGRTLEDGTKIKGLNEYINLYNQKHKDVRLPLLKPLYKMILSDRVQLSWLDEGFSSDNDLVNSVVNFISYVNDSLFGDNGLKYLLQNLNKYDLKKIFIKNDLGLTNISQVIFGRYDEYSLKIKEDIAREIANTKTIKEKKNPELFDERVDKLFKLRKSFSLYYLNHVTGEDNLIEKYFSNLGAVDNESVQTINLFSKIETCINEVQNVFASKYADLNQSDEAIIKIKNLLDAYKELQHFIKPLLGNGDEIDKDKEFDNLLSDIWIKLDNITLLYNRVRNWLTRKPYNTEKIKLNFENSTLLNGWDLNKEPDNTAIILRKNNQYYLGIMDKNFNHEFEEIMSHEGECFEKMIYKLLPGPNKMLPKVFFSNSRIEYFAPSKDIMDAYKKGTHKKTSSNFNIDDCRNLIDFFKTSIQKHEDWSKFNFKFSETSKYEGIDDFYKEVEQQGYSISFQKISVDYIDKLVNEGKLYLFQIWNKDFSEFSNGSPNLHTLYWKMLFDERNLKDVVYKLNGQAEVFYRKRSIQQDNIIVHKANIPLKNKNKGNLKSESNFEYDIIKDRRYTLDKFQFHVPITLNFKSFGRDNINDYVIEFIKNNGVEHIIGIDRGERHLLYLSMIDLKGNIVKQMTLNDINHKYGNVNYKDLLSEREGDRLEARKNWKKLDNIKDLKEGYLSQIVHIISQMMVEYKAIVVLEDLNMGFIKGRQKIEKNVYEQFEKKLIDKLNYLVFKQYNPDSVGGVLHAYQLTSKFDSFKKLGKQSGFLFYIPAWNTSKIDPITGFVNMLDTRYTSVENAKTFFSKFEKIRYNADKDWFEFVFDYKNFNVKLEGIKTKWTLCSYGNRIKTYRNEEKFNKWDSKEINLTQEFKNIFKECNIDINGNLKDSICCLKDKKHFEQLMSLMKLLLQLRNSIANSEVDYLLSPVSNNGVFYDSRSCDDTLPKDADANGAFNIARKGLILLDRIRKSETNRPDLRITNLQWLQFVQNKSNIK